MPLLCRTPRPQATESLFGFVLRVSEENGYETPRHVWKAASMPRGSECAPRFPTEPLAAVLGLKGDELHPLAYRADLEGRGSFKILSHPLGDDLRGGLLRLKHPAFCPLCVSETGYIDAFWDLSAAVACPSHGSFVLTSCPSCGRRITWERPGLLTCSCGGELREAMNVAAPRLILDVMQLLWSKLHGEGSHIDNSSRLPLEHLVSMPFGALIRLISALTVVVRANNCGSADSGNLPAAQAQPAPLATPANLSSTQGCTIAQVEAAAQILSDWPRGYHDFLRTLGERNLETGLKTVGMRKQFANFYEKLFKNRRVTREQTAFLREEFITFGLQHWGKGIIDPRMLRDKTALNNARFVSRSELARRHRLWAPAVRKMKASGALAGVTVPVKGIDRAVIDAQKTQIPAPITKILPIRQAAKQLGLTVRVLERLRADGIYKAIERRGYARSCFVDEVAAFRARLLALADVSPGRSQSGTVTLSEVVRRSTLPIETRAGLVSALLNQTLKPAFRTGTSPASIRLNREDVDAFTGVSLTPIMGSTCTFEECAESTGLSRDVIAGAVGAGLLVHAVHRGHKRITVASMQLFQSTYVPLAEIAREQNRSIRLLLNLTRRLHLPLMFLARTNNVSPQAIIPRTHLSLLTAAMEEHLAMKGARRERGNRLKEYEDRLCAYCTRKIESGQGLPRRSGGVPMKRAIALECGFSRDVFYTVPRMQRLLDEFDGKEHAMQPGRCFRPAEIVSDYLARLNRLGRPLPLCNGRPNVLRIAEESGIRRNAIQRNAEILQMLDTFASATRTR